MRAIMVAAVLSVFLALALTIAVYRPERTDRKDPETTETPVATPTTTPTPEPVIPIEIIDGEIWVAIPVEGMEK